MPGEAAKARIPLARDGQQYSAPDQLVYLRVGYTDSNTWVGSTKAMAPVYAEYRLTSDDIVCDNPGGLTIGCAGDGMLYEARFEPPDRHIYEQGGNPDSLPGEAVVNPFKVNVSDFDFAGSDTRFDNSVSLDAFGAMGRVFRV